MLKPPRNAILSCVPRAFEKDYSFETMEQARFASEYVASTGVSASLNLQMGDMVGSMLKTAGYGMSAYLSTHLRIKTVAKYEIHFPGVNELELSDRLISSLQVLWHCKYPSRNACSADLMESSGILRTIFDDFASHAMCGPMALGATYHERGSGKLIQHRAKRDNRARRIAERRIAEAIAEKTQGNSSMDAKLGLERSSSSKTEEEDEMSELFITTETQTYGGLPTNDITEWTASIMSADSDSRLAIVDRGVKIVGMWEIVGRDYIHFGKVRTTSILVEDFHSFQTLVEQLTAFHNDGVRTYYRNLLATDSLDNTYEALSKDRIHPEELTVDAQTFLIETLHLPVKGDNWVLWFEQITDDEINVYVNEEAHKVEDFARFLLEEFQIMYGPKDCVCKFCASHLLPSQMPNHLQVCKVRRNFGPPIASAKQRCGSFKAGTTCWLVTKTRPAGALASSS